MGEELSILEKEVLRALVHEFPICKEPFKEIADKLGISQEEVIAITKKLLEKKVIRRLGITLRQRFAGIEGNAMVAWKIPEELVEEVGSFLASKPWVSHCYIRETVEGWNYNLYTMVHGKNEEEVLNRVKEVADRFNLKDFEVLFTEKEIIRKSPQI